VYGLSGKTGIIDAGKDPARECRYFEFQREKKVIVNFLLFCFIILRTVTFFEEEENPGDKKHQSE
jgi:hypothetical protein